MNSHSTSIIHFYQIKILYRIKLEQVTSVSDLDSSSVSMLKVGILLIKQFGEILIFQNGGQKNVTVHEQNLL